LKVIWAVHLKCCNQIMVFVSRYGPLFKMGE
jgi:hypothetical protein